LAQFHIKLPDELREKVRGRAALLGKSINALTVEFYQRLVGEPPPAVAAKKDLAQDALWDLVLEKHRLPSYAEAHLATGLSRPRLRDNYMQFILTDGGRNLEQLEALREEAMRRWNELASRLAELQYPPSRTGLFKEEEWKKSVMEWEEEKKSVSDEELDRLREEKEVWATRDSELSEIIKELRKEREWREEKEEMQDAGYGWHESTKTWRQERFPPVPSPFWAKVKKEEEEAKAREHGEDEQGGSQSSGNGPD